MYSENTDAATLISALTSTVTSGKDSVSGVSIIHSKYSVSSITSEILPLYSPSTNILTLSPGSFSICFTFATVPISYKSEISGNSISSSFCNTKNTNCSRIIACSKATIDLSRPTSKLTSIPGNTQSPRIGITGKSTISSSGACISFKSIS